MAERDNGPLRETSLAVRTLLVAARSPRHTVQEMPDPFRYEVIYAGPRPYPSRDERAGTIEHVVYVEPDGRLRVEDCS